MRCSEQPYWFCIFSLPILPLIYKNIRNSCFFFSILVKSSVLLRLATCVLIGSRASELLLINICRSRCEFVCAY